MGSGGWPAGRGLGIGFGGPPGGYGGSKGGPGGPLLGSRGALRRGPWGASGPPKMGRHGPFLGSFGVDRCGPGGPIFPGFWALRGVLRGSWRPPFGGPGGGPGGPLRGQDRLPETPSGQDPRVRGGPPEPPFLGPCGEQSRGSGGAPPTHLILLRNQWSPCTLSVALQPGSVRSRGWLARVWGPLDLPSEGLWRVCRPEIPTGLRRRAVRKIAVRRSPSSLPLAGSVPAPCSGSSAFQVGGLDPRPGVDLGMSAGDTLRPVVRNCSPSAISHDTPARPAHSDVAADAPELAAAHSSVRPMSATQPTI